MLTYKYLLSITPPYWDLRGSPYLWEEIKNKLHQKQITDINCIKDDIIKSFYDICGNAIKNDDIISINRFSHGGMSSGQISISFWGNKLIPFIQRNMLELLKQNIPEEQELLKQILQNSNCDVWIKMFAHTDKDVYFLYNSQDKAYENVTPKVFCYANHNFKEADVFDFFDDYQKLI